MAQNDSEYTGEAGREVTAPLADQPFLHGAPTCSGLIRHCPEDFCVDEVLGFEPEGEGEHLFLQLRKRGDNTAWVARQLARLAEVPVSAVTYSGLKDRHAVTSQWFGIHLPGRQDPDLSPLAAQGLELLARARHRKKLRTGVHRGNRFRILIRELDQPQSLEARLEQIRSRGVPNYFGEQRFGHQGGNLEKAAALFAGELRVRDRKLKGLYLSAARSFLFNQVVAGRLAAGCFEQVLAGDRFILDGSNSLFSAPQDPSLQQRMAQLDIHPTGPLYGQGELGSEADCRHLEAGILAPYEGWCRGLEAAGLRQERRALRLRVQDLTWRWPSDDQLELAFYLPAGAFATSVLRELCSYRVALADDGNE